MLCEAKLLKTRLHLRGRWREAPEGECFAQQSYHSLGASQIEPEGLVLGLAFPSGVRFSGGELLRGQEAPTDAKRRKVAAATPLMEEADLSFFAPQKR